LRPWIAATVVPLRVAIEKNVSAVWTVVYSAPPAEKVKVAVLERLVAAAVVIGRVVCAGVAAGEGWVTGPDDVVVRLGPTPFPPSAEWMRRARMVAPIKNAPGAA
jgi:hypothetical protein